MRKKLAICAAALFVTGAGSNHLAAPAAAATTGPVGCTLEETALAISAVHEICRSWGFDGGFMGTCYGENNFTGECFHL